MENTNFSSNFKIVIALDIKFNEGFFPYGKECHNQREERFVVPVMYDQEEEDVGQIAPIVAPDETVEVIMVSKPEDNADIEEED